MSQEKPGISIITAFYNTGPVFWETYASINSQTYTDWEWIIVNDGSDSKESLSILEQSVQQGKGNIKVIHLEKNTGLPGARNKGISYAKAPYLMFIDSDDLIDELALEKFYLVLENNPGMQFVNSYVIGFEGQQYKWKGGFHEGSVFLQENRNTSCFMAQRGVFDLVLFDEKLINGGEDWDFWLHAASKGYWGHTIPEYLILYRRRSGPNKWKALSSEKELERIGRSLREKYGAILQKNFPERRLSEYQFQKVYDPAPIPISPDLSSSKTILFLFPWLEVGGADKYNLDLITGLKHKEWKITIGCTKSNEQSWADLFAQQTKDIFFFPHYSGENGFYKTLYYIINTRRPSVIFISNAMYAYYVLPYIRQYFPHIPVVDYLHCEDPGWYNGGYPVFSSVFSRLLDKTFVSSVHLKQWCIPKGAIAEKIEVAYTNVDTEAVKRNENTRISTRSALNVDNSKPVILYVARLTEQKQPLVFLSSIEKLYAHTTDFLAIVIGNGPDQPLFLKKLKSASSGKNIIYLGEQPNDRVKEYMDAADIFFLPTAYEGIALTIYEAMSKGLTIVAANVGGQAELVTNDCGVLVQRSDPEQESTAYADHLYQFIINKDKIKESGQRARERVVNHFQLSNMIHDMDLALQQVIQQHNTAAPLITEEYLAVLNRLLDQQQVAENLEDQLSNRVNRMLRKYNKEYRLAKKIYHKIKSIGSKKK